MDLFDSESVDESGVPVLSMAPLTVRMRPTTLAEVVGQSRLLGEGSVAALNSLRVRTMGSHFLHVVLWGPPGYQEKRQLAC